MFRLQKNHPVAAALAQLWQDFKQDMIGRAKILEKKLENGLNNGSFGKFWSATSVKIIGYLIVVLVSLLFAVVGYNFAKDDECHTYNRMMVERMRVEVDTLKCEGEKTRQEIRELKHEFKDESAEIKKILMKKYYDERGGSNDN